MSKPNLLFITPELPYPPQSGGKVKSLKLLESLCERYTVDLASPLKLDDTEHTAELQAATTCRNYLHAELDVVADWRHDVAQLTHGVEDFHKGSGIENLHQT